MPTYEYECQTCHHPFEVFLTYAAYEKTAVRCPQCGSESVRKKISRIHIKRSESRRIENMVDPSQLGSVDEDPQALGKLMRQMGSEMDENLGPEFDEVVSRLEKGQSPEQIEKDMPELGDIPGSAAPPNGIEGQDT